MEIRKGLFGYRLGEQRRRHVDQFEKMSAEFAGTKYAVATSSGTTALHICLILMGVNEKRLCDHPEYHLHRHLQFH